MPIFCFGIVRSAIVYTYIYTYQGILRKNYSNFTYLFKDHSYKTNLIFFPSKMPHIMGFWANIKSFRVPTFYNYMYLHVPLDYHSQPYPSDSLPGESYAHRPMFLYISLPTHCDLVEDQQWSPRSGTYMSATKHTTQFSKTPSPVLHIDFLSNSFTSFPIRLNSK